jgi:protein TonB
VPARTRKRSLTSTIYLGFALSLALHSSLALPFILRRAASPPEPPRTLVIEVEGMVADTQTEEKVVEETKAEAKPEAAPETQPAEKLHDTEPEVVPANQQPADVAAEPPPAPPEQAEPAVPAEEASLPTTETKPASANDVPGADERQDAQTIKSNREEIDRFGDYAKQLTKKVQAHLVYPEEARQGRLQGNATVSFTILPNGQIRPETLKITVSSGQPTLDASALKTVRMSVPFNPPPQEMTVALAVAFGGKCIGARSCTAR